MLVNSNVNSSCTIICLQCVISYSIFYWKYYTGGRLYSDVKGPSAKQAFPNHRRRRLLLHRAAGLRQPGWPHRSLHETSHLPTEQRSTLISRKAFHSATMMLIPKVSQRRHHEDSRIISLRDRSSGLRVTSDRVIVDCWACSWLVAIRAIDFNIYFGHLEKDIRYSCFEHNHFTQTRFWLLTLNYH